MKLIKSFSLSSLAATFTPTSPDLGVTNACQRSACSNTAQFGKFLSLSLVRLSYSLNTLACAWAPWCRVLFTHTSTQLVILFAKYFDAILNMRKTYNCPTHNITF